MSTKVHRATRRLFSALLAATAVVAFMPGLGTQSGAAPGFTIERLEGSDRFATAADIAVDTFGTANEVLIARGDQFPDALAGSYLAGAIGRAPILLTLPDTLPAPTANVLATLGATKATLLGGPAAISETVAEQLRQRGIGVTRIGGANRYDTARLISEAVNSADVGVVDGARTAIVTSGLNFPDALAAGPLSFDAGLPVFLTEFASLPSPTRQALQRLQIARVFVFGGTSAVSTAVAAELQAMGITVERFGGANRQETAVLIAEMAISRLRFAEEHVNIARGDAFADALAGGPHAGFETGQPGNDPGPILLTGSPTDLGASTRSFLEAHAGTLQDGHVFGGPAAVSQAVVDDAEAAASGSSDRVRIVLNSSTAVQGGTISGRLSGSGIDKTFVSGCGITPEQEYARTGDNTFTIGLPASQPSGTCTLTFRTAFTDRTEEIDNKQITVTSPSAAPETATSSPELVSAAVVRTFRAPNPLGTPAQYDQTTVRFTFDEPVTGAALISQNGDGTNNCTNTTTGCSAKFVLYSFDQTADTQNPYRIYEGRAAQVDPDNSSSVLVSFGSPAVDSSEVGAEELAEITTAGVLPKAVADNSSPAAGFEETRFNPPGDAPLSAAAFEAGRTTAPDLVQVSNFRPETGSTATLVDFTFDEPAVWVRRTAGPTGYHLVLNDDPATVRDCTRKANTATTGDGKSIHTLSCGLNGISQITSATTARGYVDANTVASPGNTTNGASTDPKISLDEQNPAQAVDVSSGGATSGADLASAEFSAGTSTYDVVTYVFDEHVIHNNTATSFAIWLANGREVAGNAGGITDTSTDPTKVIVRFPERSLDLAVGASVKPNAVIEGSGTNQPNLFDSVAVRPLTVSAGSTSAPDFDSCRLDVTQVNPISGAPEQYQLVFRFDKPLSSTFLDASKFRVYQADGLEITAPLNAAGNGTQGKNPVRRAAPNTNEVLLDGFDNRAQMLRIASCGVEPGAVTSETAPGDLNPVGYEVIS